ncbi:hypothetical protein GCM10009541_14590 [Micromonospora gifhornensis]|uniref:Uncharacterized protein n=1 Tax=Micromonospora gifhornensis TaxID=84594 RepID=A0ABQ4IFG9_9ACTN|nr:hypothetical protein Vgi01_33350 [Micromonospora gifhornensis]
MVDDWASAAKELSGLSARHRVAFVAATVQRGAPAFTDLIRRRRADHEFFAETVGFLWAVAAGAEATAIPARRARLNKFKEMRAKPEADDERFFAEQAVFLLDYALDTVEGDRDGATSTIKCALHMMDGFDQDLGEDDNYDRELGVQERVLQELRLSAIPSADEVSELRCQALLDAELTRAAVRRVLR